MGQEIEQKKFSKRDFDLFSKKLEKETNALSILFENNELDNDNVTGGFEIEACLIGLSGIAAPLNNIFLDTLKHPLVVHELAAFNVELNSTPLTLTGDCLSNMRDQLQSTWDACRAVANDLSIEMMMIGILPSILEKQLRLEYMSKLNRYQALNEQVIKLRDGRPLKLDIRGKEEIQTSHLNVMLESACTSLQLHLQTPIKRAAQTYNASIILSAPMVAATANSPYLFGNELWDETRIPLFEQAVELGNTDYRRVTFGSGYIETSLFECFAENLEHYPVLVPLKDKDELHEFSCLRFHNGTIWRWNRPLLGFDESGKPHVRIEHRVIPSGPSIIDSIANTAFYFGLATELAKDVDSMINQLPFHSARDNFYHCAKHGLSANLKWPNHNSISVKELLLEELLPAAQRGLDELGITQKESDEYLSIIQQRIETEQNGTNWQRRWVNKNGNDMKRLTQCYLEQQNSGKPVHEWSL